MKIIGQMGRSDIIILMLLIAFVSWGLLKKEKRLKDPMYTKGLVIGISKGSKGSQYLNYYFYANSKQIEGSVSVSFCKKCNYTCCDKGDTVIVRYEKDNPGNNDLVLKLPDGKNFSE